MIDVTLKTWRERFHMNGGNNGNINININNGGGFQGYNNAPVAQLKTNKGLLKYILLSAITFGIYGIVVMCAVSNEINITASRHDGKSTMNFLLCAILSPLGLGIPMIVWYHRISNRMGYELRRRGIAYSFSASDFWLWDVLGALLCCVGPFVYAHKMFQACNMINAHYNING